MHQKPKSAAALLRPIAGTLAGKTVLQLATGSAKTADDLIALLTRAGAGWLIGIINAYPGMIGKADAVILYVCPESSFNRTLQAYYFDPQMTESGFLL